MLTSEKIKSTVSILLAVVVFSLYSCKNHQQDFFNSPVLSSKNIQFTSLKFDTVRFEGIPSSYVGTFHQSDDTIYFVDHMFCNVFLFDKNGRFIERHLGSGGGPNEIPSGQIVAFQKLKNGSYVVLGPSSDLYTFNNSWQRTNKVIINKNIKYSQKELMTSPKPEMQGIYDIDYEKNMNIQEYGSKIVVPIESLMDKFNPTMKDYYSKSRIFFEINFEDGNVENMFGRRSPFYNSFNCIGQFSWFNFDITENDIMYICHEPDSLIYVYDNDKNNIQSFGCAGKDMNTNYIESNSFEQTGLMLFEERKNKGYYSHIKHIDKVNLLFRSYQKGIQSNKDGLQIYKNGVLIGDIEVPKGFKVMGYNKPYFYSEGFIDEDYETIHLLKFKLDI